MIRGCSDKRGGGSSGRGTGRGPAGCTAPTATAGVRGNLEPMGWVNAVLIAYAALNIAGGILGYVKAHSLPSVISGSLIGVLLIVAVALTRSNARAGTTMAAIVTALTLLWSVRSLFAKGGPFWQTMVVASLAVLACLIAGHVLDRAR